jgi:hypothetical protein
MSQPLEDMSEGVLAVWDGSRFAFQAAERLGVIALVSHTAAGQELTAVWESAAGACIAALPENCRHVELQLFDGGLPTRTIAVELDELLLPDLIAPGLAGLRTISCTLSESGLVLSASADGAVRGLALPGPAAMGATPFSRLRVGPLHDPAGPGRRILLGAEAGPDGVMLATEGAEALPLVAHVFGGDDAGRALPAEADASGASAETCRERGFRMLAFAAGQGMRPTLAIPGFGPGDEAIAFAPRGHVVAWRGEPDRTGSRLFLSRDDSGAWQARAVSAAYRPATSTAMASLGGGGALALYEGGATATAKGADFAADLAEAIWRRHRAPRRPEAGWLAAVPAPHKPLPPLARLTSLGGGAAQGLSPVIAGLAPAFGVATAALEELDGLPLPDRLALVLWFADHSTLATRVLRRRLVLPPPGSAPPPARIAALLDWSEETDLRERLESAAARLGSASADDREGQRLLRHAAALLDEGWINLDTLVAAETVMRSRGGATGEAEDGPLRRLLARLRSDREVFAAAQAASRGLDLGQLAEWRSGLADAAADGGQPAALIEDMAGRLAELAATDIILLHRHFRSAARRIKALGAVREAVAALDAAAGNGGLAARMDRDGDGLVGMTRLGSASEAAVRALTRVPAARPSLVALTSFIDRHVAAEPADALLGDLRRNLQRYGCLLLAQAIARECAEAMAPDTDDAPEQAWRERLRSGVVEMLPAYVRAAAESLPDEAALGTSFTDRLPAAP